MNKNGKYLWSCDDNTQFQKKDIHRYIWMCEVDGRQPLQHAEGRLLDIMCQGASGGLSDHFLVEVMVKVCRLETFGE